MAPINDNLANAILISAGYNAVTGTTIDATQESGEFAALGYNPGPNVWYQLENLVPLGAVGINKYVVDLNSITTGYEPYAEVYYSTIPNPDYSDLVLLDSVGDGTENPPTLVSNLDDNGEYYWLMVASWNGSDVGNFVINIATPWGGRAEDNIHPDSTTASSTGGWVKDTQSFDTNNWPYGPMINQQDDMADTFIFTAPTDGLWSVYARTRMQGSGVPANSDGSYIGIVRNNRPLYHPRVVSRSDTGIAGNTQITDDLPLSTYAAATWTWLYERHIRTKAGDTITIRLLNEDYTQRYAEIESIVFSPAPELLSPYYDPDVGTSVTQDNYVMDEFPLGSESNAYYNLSDDVNGLSGFVNSQITGNDLTIMPNGDLYVAWGEERGTGNILALAKWDGVNWTQITKDIWKHATSPIFDKIEQVSVSGNTGTGGVTASFPANVIDDVAIIFGIARSGVTLNTPSGYTLKSNWTRGSTNYYVFWKRFTSSSGGAPTTQSVTVTGSGDKYVAGYLVRNTVSSGDPFNAFTTQTGTSDPETITGITTTEENSLVCLFGGLENHPNTNVTITNGSPKLSSFLTSSFISTTVGADAEIFVRMANKFDAGATGDYTMDFSSSGAAGWGTFLCAFKPNPNSDAAPDSGIGGMAEYFPAWVAIDNDGVDLYIAWGEEQPNDPAINNIEISKQIWRCMKYEINSTIFTELGNPYGQYHNSGTNGNQPNCASFANSLRMKVSPGGKPWVAWIEYDYDIVGVANGNARPFVWRWSGSTWVETNLPDPPINRRTTNLDDWYAYAVHETIIHLDITFCTSADGVGENPSVIWIVDWGLAFDQNYGEEIVYSEWNGSSWETIQLMAQDIWEGLIYTTRENLASIGYGHWAQGMSLTNDGTNPIFSASLGTFNTLFDFLACAKIVDNAGSPEFQSLGLPGAAYAEEWGWSFDLAGSAACDGNNIYVIGAGSTTNNICILVNREAGDDLGWMVASKENAFVWEWTQILQPMIAAKDKKAYFLHTDGNGVFGAWQLNFTPGGPIHLSRIRFRAFAQGDS
jgi:hypothetical protein